MPASICIPGSSPQQQLFSFFSRKGGDGSDATETQTETLPTRQHKARRLSPAMAAGLTDQLLSMTDLANMVDAAAPKPGKRGPYIKAEAA